MEATWSDDSWAEAGFIKINNQTILDLSNDGKNLLVLTQKGCYKLIKGMKLKKIKLKNPENFFKRYYAKPKKPK